jgi:import inner membrane translocase subunit TIM22
MRYDTPISGPLPVATPTTKPTTAATGATATAGVKPSVIATSNLNSVSATTLPSAPSASASAIATLPGANVPLADLPMRQQIKAGLRDMYRSSLASGRNFAKVGAIFSGTECAIEGLRAKNDLYNGVAGGCLTGGILARNAGPQAVAVGCAGFAVFSAAIDAYMRMPEDERSKPIA